MPLDKQKISDAVEKYYPSAVNAPGVGYIVLDEAQNIARIDPVAQTILETSETQCLNESLKMFMPSDTPIKKHKTLVAGAMSNFEKDAKEGGQESVSMGLDEYGEPKARTVRTGKDNEVLVKFDIGVLPIDGKKWPIAFIRKASDSVKLINLAEEKRVATQDIKLRIVAETSNVMHGEVKRWFSLFEGVFGESRVGKIASLIATFGLFGAAIYGALGFLRIIRPPTIQDIRLSPPSAIEPSTDISTDEERSEPAKNRPNSKQ